VTDHRQDVQELYERQPYPTPPEQLDGFVQRKLITRGAPSLYYHLYWPFDKQRKDLDILIAGCGTSQAAEMALYEPKANITAIDFSNTSLQHTRKLLDKYNINNVELHHLPIEQAGKLDKQFDLIVSTGVLHHLPDPTKGLAILRDQLKPDGAMYLMVYGQYGRTGVYMFQRYCQLLNVGLDDASLLQFQQVLKHLPVDHPLVPLAKRSSDLSCTAGLADMFVHPCDRAYTVPQVYEWLDGAQMSFSRWFLQGLYLPQCSMLADSAHAKALAELPIEQQYEAVELFRGNLHMHYVIAVRNDRPTQTYKIEWNGDTWKDYVPRPMPGIAASTENLPAGVLVELAQSGHEFPMRKPQLTSQTVPLYQAMDGKRTLSEIAKQTNVNPQSVRDFFRSLWEFDQIMLLGEHAAK